MTSDTETHENPRAGIAQLVEHLICNQAGTGAEIGGNAGAAAKAPTAPPTACEIRQYSDQMICHDCGRVWDANDPSPPPCRAVRPPLPNEYLVIEPSREKGGVFLVARRMIGSDSYTEFARTGSRFAARKIAEALNKPCES